MEMLWGYGRTLQDVLVEFAATHIIVLGRGRGKGGGVFFFFFKN